ncbi:MAG: glycosyltransferase [Candidatus Omnitrophica bacterium]|nr:glycosyltransferase [Candidatus Omnitrophota bacterium]
MAGTDVDVTLWATRQAYDPSLDTGPDQELQRSGVKLQYFPLHSWGFLGNRYAYSSQLGKVLRQEIPKMDLLHLHGVWEYPTTIAARICRRKNIPYILSPCGALDPTGFQNHRLFKWLYGLWIERKNLAGAASLCFTSSLEKQYAYLFGVRRPSAVIPCCVRMNHTPDRPAGDFRGRHPEVGQRRILLFLGRLHPIKRLDLLAHAFVMVARRIDDVHLVIAGPEGGAGTQLRRILSEAGLLDHATFTGQLIEQDKWAALRDSTLLLLPSEHENFGMAALEAMSAGVPVLVSPHVGLADSVKKSGAGLVVERDPSEWASAIEHLLRQPQSLRSMRESGRRLTATEFDSRQIADSMHQLYLSVIQNQGPKIHHA